MIERRSGEMTTIECRHDANEAVDRRQRCAQVLTCLREHGGRATAKQIAVMMRQKGYTGSDDRNVAAPRLTELGRSGDVEPVGKQVCEYTGRTVTVWGLCNG